MGPSRKRKRVDEEEFKCVGCLEDGSECKPAKDTTKAPYCARCLQKHRVCSFLKPTQVPESAAMTQKALSEQTISRSRLVEPPEIIPILSKKVSTEQLAQVPQPSLSMMYWAEHLMRLKTCMKKKMKQWPQMFNDGDIENYAPFKRMNVRVDYLRDQVNGGSPDVQATTNHGSSPSFATSPKSPSITINILATAVVNYSTLASASSLQYKANLEAMVKEHMEKGNLVHAIKLQEQLVNLLCSSRPSYPKPHVNKSPHDNMMGEARSALLLFQELHGKVQRVTGCHQPGERFSNIPLLEHSAHLMKVAIRCRFFFRCVDALGRSIIHLVLSNGSPAFKEIDILPMMSLSRMVYHVDTLGLAPIHLACLNGHAAAVQLLVRRRVPLDLVVGDSNWVPLHCAVYSGDLATVNSVLDGHLAAGLDRDWQTITGESALHLASIYCQESLVKLLIQRGLSPHVLNYDGYSVFHLAVMFGQVETTMWLLEYDGAGFDVSVGKTQSSPLHLACTFESNNSKEIVDLLLQDPNISNNQKDLNGQTALHLAVNHGHEEIVYKLIDCAGVDVDLVNGDDETPLFLAAGLGHRKIVERLLKTRRVSVANNWNDENPYTIAKENGHTQIAQMIKTYYREERNVAPQVSSQGEEGQEGDADSEDEMRVVNLVIKHEGEGSDVSDSDTDVTHLDDEGRDGLPIFADCETSMEPVPCDESDGEESWNGFSSDATSEASGSSDEEMVEEKEWWEML